MADDQQHTFGPSMFEVTRSPFWKEAATEDGKRHGYPSCCVFFFVELWAPMASADPTKDIERLWADYSEKINSVGMGDGYIPCPACLQAALLKKNVA
jgi:hypothetical protein